MRLEEQVCSLELSKRLKELGVRQESAFIWYHPKRIDGSINRGDYLLDKSSYPKLDEQDRLSAFSVAELGEMLPKAIINSRSEWFLRVNCDLTGFNYVYFRDYNTEDLLCEKDIEADTEANARAKMLIHLIEEGIVKP